MSALQRETVFTAHLSGTTGVVAKGKGLLLNQTGNRFIVATDANRTLTGRKTACIALEAGDNNNTSVQVQFSGVVPASVTGLGVGSETTIYVDSTGSLARGGTQGVNDMVGRCDVDGTAYIQCGGTAGAAGGPPNVADDIAKSAGDVIDRVQGFRGRALSSTTPRVGETYTYNGSQHVPGRRIIHVGLFGAIPDATEGVDSSGTDCSAAVQAALDSVDTTDKFHGCVVEFDATEGKAYRFSHTVNIRRNAILRGQGGSMVWPGTLIQCDAGVTPFRVLSETDDLANSPGGAHGTVIEDLVIRATARNLTTITCDYSAVSNPSVVSNMSSTADFTVGQLVCVDGVGAPCLLQEMVANCSSSSTTVTLSSTGDRSLGAMGDAGGGDGVPPGTTTAGWYITIPGAFNYPTRVVSVSGLVLTMASASSGAATNQVVRWRSGLVGMVVSKTSSSLTLDAYGASLAEGSADLIMTAGTGRAVNVRHWDSGIDVRNKVHINGVSVGGNFVADGFLGAAFALRGDHNYVPLSTGVNLSTLTNCASYHNRHCIWATGADSNACTFVAVHSHRSWDWSFVDLSNLGNTYIGTHADSGKGIVTLDTSASAATFVYPYTEGGTENSFGAGCTSIGGAGGGLYAGGFRISGGYANYFNIGDPVETKAHQTRFLPDTAFIAFKSKTGAAELRIAATFANYGSAPGFIGFQHATQGSSHPLVFADSDQSTFSSTRPLQAKGTMWIPTDFMFGDDDAKFLNVNYAARMASVASDLTNGWSVIRDPHAGAYDIGYGAYIGELRLWKKGDWIRDINLLDGCPTRHVIEDGHRGSEWVASTVYAQYSIVCPTIDNHNGRYYINLGSSGTSNGTEPTWGATSLGGTVSDNTVTWTDLGPAAYTQPVELDGYIIYTMAADANESWSRTDRQFLCGSVKVLKTLGADRTLTLPKGRYRRWIWNATTGGFNLLVKCSGGSLSVTIAAGKAAEIQADGAEMRRRTADVTP